MVVALRIIHILAGVFWVRSVLFATLLLTPALKASGPAAGTVMNQLVGARRMPIYMMASGLLTMAAGIWLLLIDSAMQPGVWMRSGTGMTFSMGGGLAILAFVVGMAVNMPASQRLAAIGSAVAARGGPPTAEEQAQIQKYQGRMSTASKIVAFLLVLCTIAMAVARYVQ